MKPGTPVLTQNAQCSRCPAIGEGIVAESAIVRLEESPCKWSQQPQSALVHLAAIFRDPGIKDKRKVSVVLDLAPGPDGFVAAGQACWVRQFLEALTGLPRGLTIALDNGVRCPCPKEIGFIEYSRRADYCAERTWQWLGGLKHPSGGRPGVLICDKDLATSYSALGFIKGHDGNTWHCPSPFIDGVGTELTLFSEDQCYAAMILAHPVLFTRAHGARYRASIQEKKVHSKIVRLAKMGGD